MFHHPYLQFDYTKITHAKIDASHIPKPNTKGAPTKLPTLWVFASFRGHHNSFIFLSKDTKKGIGLCSIYKGVQSSFDSNQILGMYPFEYEAGGLGSSKENSKFRQLLSSM
jgi:hypothetical protein